MHHLLRAVQDCGPLVFHKERLQQVERMQSYLEGLSKAFPSAALPSSVLGELCIRWLFVARSYLREWNYAVARARLWGTAPPSLEVATPWDPAPEPSLLKRTLHLDIVPLIRACLRADPQREGGGLALRSAWRSAANENIFHAGSERWSPRALYQTLLALKPEASLLADVDPLSEEAPYLAVFSEPFFTLHRVERDALEELRSRLFEEDSNTALDQFVLAATAEQLPWPLCDDSILQAILRAREGIEVSPYREMLVTAEGKGGIERSALDQVVERTRNIGKHLEQRIGWLREVLETSLRR